MPIRYLPKEEGKRIIKPEYNAAIRAISYFQDPKYTDSGITGAGGKNSSAILGPSAGRNANSVANPNLPSYIKTARTKYVGGADFKAGHLLNGEFGGAGNDANNLTILTAAGNANHKNFDNRVKDALACLKNAYKSLYDDGIDIQKVKIGIKVDVKVNTTNPWPSEPKIFKGLTCTSSIYYGGLGYKEILNEFETIKYKNSFKNHITELNNKLILATKDIVNSPLALLPPPDPEPTASPNKKTRKRKFDSI